VSRWPGDRRDDGAAPDGRSWAATARRPRSGPHHPLSEALRRGLASRVPESGFGSDAGAGERVVFGEEFVDALLD